MTSAMNRSKSTREHIEAEEALERKAREFNTIATEVFAPIYPVIASQILAAWARFQGEMQADSLTGHCLDLGSGAGHLGISLARQSQMFVTLMDTNVHALALTREVLGNDPVAGRVITLPGDARHIPLGAQSCSLVCSRGSVWFWADRAQAFREIWRVLKPGGLAYIGGGFGNQVLARQIHAAMTERNGNDWSQRQKEIRSGVDGNTFREILSGLGYPHTINDDESGLWVLIHKP